MKEIKLLKDRTLVDPNFSGYKLSLDGLVTRSQKVGGCGGGPLNILPSADQYSYLHASIFSSSQNHVVCDPWDAQGDTAYFIAKEGQVFRVGDGQAGEVWSLPGQGGEESQQYNSRLVFIDCELAALSDGRGGLHIINTGDRKSGAAWKCEFSEAVCGKGRAFILAAGELQGQGMELVLQYVAHREEVEGVNLPSSRDKESPFLNCMERVSLVRGGAGWCMERVRRYCTRGTVHSTALIASTMVVCAEGSLTLVFDSSTPLESGEEIDMEEVERLGNGETQQKESFYWRKERQELELWAYVEETSTEHLEVTLSQEERLLECRVRGQALFSGKLWSQVAPDSLRWSLEGGKVAVILSTIGDEDWPQVWDGDYEAGVRVTDMSEDRLLRHLTTESPLSVGSKAVRQPSFNPEQLEECDSCDSEARLEWWPGEGEGASASMEGQQFLFSLPSQASSVAHPVMRNDVDGLVWAVERDTAKHTLTFPAAGYVTASKSSRKFSAAPASGSYWCIADSSRHIYLYRQPMPLAAEVGLRNRRSGERVERVARQQVITLQDSPTEILGLAAGDRNLFVLTADTLHVVTVM